MDANSDGMQDASEPGISGIGLWLYASNGALLGHAITDGSGSFLFTGVPEGSHVLRVDTGTLPGDLVATFDRDGILNNKTPINMGTGDIVLDADFGYRSLSAPTEPEH